MNSQREQKAITPWLCTTPGQLLDECNMAQPLAKYDTLSIRIYIFYKDAVLLELEDNARGWAVPTLQCKASLTAGTDAPSKFNPAIMNRVIEHLKHVNVPSSLIHELQFMEFSHANPSSIPPTPNTKPNHKVIAVVLTTSNPASGKGVLALEKVLVPKGTKFRWVPVTEQRLIIVPFCTQSIDPSLDFFFEHVLGALQRLTTCSRQALQARIVQKNIWELCAQVLSSILFTRRLVIGRDGFGSGTVAVGWDGEKPYVVLIEDMEEHGARQVDFREISHGGEKLVVIGKWSAQGVEVLGGWPGWTALLDASGRLREAPGLDEE